ncbi:F-box only protein 42 [Anopheles stephensi]|uniref:F-box domain-containing protein n=1 Tax=Anopheles stephensi TaxID=30069 RepID=A0A182Y1K7_ANOST|nr:F-box only protein 42 [Anopheles stephensi]
MTANINDLPNEILEFIFSLLPPYEPLEHCAAVCKRWNLLATNVKARKKSNLQKGLIDSNLCWKEILHESTPRIAARFAHASSLHRNSMYVFGGASSYDTTFNDLWKFDLSRREWIRPISMGTYPSPKAGASLVCHNDLLILYGGWRHAYTPFHMCTLIDELHVYNIAENRWTIHNQAFGPPPMTGHSATVHHNQMILFGGYQNNMETLRASNDIWVLDLQRLVWKKPAVSDLKPSPRFGQFQMAVGDDHILVLGGTGGVNRVFNDAWLLDMQRDTWLWKRVQIKNKKSTINHNWCYPACNVGSKVIVLGPTSPNDFQIIRPSRAPPVGRARPSAENHRHRMGIPQGVHGAEPNIPRNNPPQRPNLPPPPPAPIQPVPVLLGLLSNKESNASPAAPAATPKPSPVQNMSSEARPGPSGLRSPGGSASAPPLRSMPIIRSAFGRQSSEDDHLPKRFNQQNMEQNHMAMVAFSVDSTNHSSIVSSSRERQLERLRKMEEKISAMRRSKEAEQQLQQQQQQPQPQPQLQQRPVDRPPIEEHRQDEANESGQGNRDPGNACESVSTSGSDPVTPKRVKRNGLAIYVCDVSNILPTGGAEPCIEWQESKNSGLIVGAPDHHTFSTMVNGNGELIVFGGLNKNHKSENLSVSNSVHFLTVPTAVV